jgi:hypothetical protein
MIWIEQNHSSKANSLSDSQETASLLMCSHWTLPVGGESFQHPLIMFLFDPVVREGDEILKQEPLLHTKMGLIYFFLGGGGAATQRGSWPLHP